MRVGPVLLALWLLGCGEKPELPQYVDMTWVPDPAFDLPRVPADGPAWRDLGLDTAEIVVELHPNGRISSKRRSYGLKELKNHFRLMAETRRDSRDPSGTNPSLVPLILRSDRTVPWARMRTVLETASDGDVRIVNAYFVVAGEGERSEATRSVRLPVGPGPFERPWTYPWYLPPQHWVAVLPTRGPSSKPSDLAAALPPGGFPDEERVAMLDVDGRLPAETILMVIDVLWRAGAPGIVVRQAEGGGMGDGVEILLDGRPVSSAGDIDSASLPDRQESWGLGVR